MDHEHKRGTHTQFNEVFTDNSNCQILVPNDIVQSADAHNRLSLSPARSLLVKQADLISGKNLLGGKREKRLWGLPVRATDFTKRENNPARCISELRDAERLR